MGRNLTRWLIPLPAILFAIWPTTVRAEPIPGLNTTYYTIDEIPPVQSTDEYPVCGSETENNINRSYDGEPYGNCTGDLFMVHMTGYITIPEHDTIEFMLAHDDGGEITIDGNTFGVWWDQGCSWSMSNQLELNAESVPLELWMYENGGSTCIMLAWNIDGEGWAMVPDSAFTTNAVVQTTSTTTSTTTTTSSTTTLPTTTTTVQSTTTTQTTTTTSTTTIPIQTTTTTTEPYTPPQTTTSVEPEPVTTPIDDEPEPEPATTTSEPDEPESETTEPETSTTYPDETVPETTEPETTVPDETVPDETETPTTTTPQEEETTDTELEEEQDSSTTTIPDLDPTVDTPEELEAFVEELDIQENEPITEEKLDEILEVLADATPAQVVAAVEQLLATDITPDQAAEIASTPEVLAAITEEQAEQLFEQLDVEELSEEQLEAFTAAIQEAPTKVKKAFEKTIDIFSSQFENYVPTGSNIPVKTRRTLVAVGALIAAIPPTRIRR